MAASVDDLFREMENLLQGQIPVAALRSLKALTSSARDTDAIRKVRHSAIELLAQLADMREELIAHLRDAGDLDMAHRELCDTALALVASARLSVWGSTFDATASDAWAVLETYTYRGEEIERHRRRGIFISYRRAESIDIAGRIHDRLRTSFRTDQVFMDTQSMPPGINFRLHVVNTISRCRACLILIGGKWLNCKDDQGRRRLDDDLDPVRTEVETALRVKVTSIPLLLGDTSMPSAADLPSSISELHYNHALRLRPNPDFDNDMAKLIDALKPIL